MLQYFSNEPYLNGIRLSKDDDYLLSGNMVTFLGTAIPQIGDDVSVVIQ